MTRLLDNPYWKLIRLDRWIMSAFILPGAVLALVEHPEFLDPVFLGRVLLAIIAMGVVASANYVCNEVLDAGHDALHPDKRFRPVPMGQVVIRRAWWLHIALAIAGLGLAWTLGRWVFLSALALLVMGYVYNVSPLRTKDKPYLDVLTESINNPIRFLAGWYAAGMLVPPPVSLLTAYWMVGAFFMSVKRLAEYRRIDDKETAKGYRSSFAHYDEHSLVASTVYYAVAFGLFFGIFLARYQIELILSIPFIAGFIGWYLRIGFTEDSLAQRPETLYRNSGFMLYAMFCAALILGLLFVDIPLVGEIFSPSMQME
jgi:decaprenyl-phosphate phosphoribosyltransferase